ncbi:Type IV pilus inner membrane component PilO [Gammaproteobacteria bacterium]
MNLQDLNSLDFNNIGSWPLPARIGLIVVAVVVLLGVGYYVDTQSEIELWDTAELKEKTLRETFEKLQGEAVNLEIYRQQMADLRQSFNIMLRQLPRKAEVDALLVDISQTGLAAGLEFELFKPGNPGSQEFQNLPIQIRVTGTYHEFGKFVSGVAALPRIVTLHDVTLIPEATNDKNKKGKLSMDAVARIYHYQDEGTGK